MAFRFQRRIKIAPGIRLNVSKTGASLSVGRDGATVNLNKNGVRGTAGIPGTGLSYSKPSRRPPQASDGDTDRTSAPWLMLAIASTVAMIAALFGPRR